MTFTLVDLEGNAYGRVNGSFDWLTVFNKLKPVCPKCGGVLSVENLHQENA